MNEIRVVLIEDHELSRIGLIAALEQRPDIKVVGEASTGRQGLQVLRATKPDVAIVDIGLPDMDGIELTQKFKLATASEDPPETKILILTMHKNEDAVLASFAAGADSYSLKDVNMPDLLQAIKTTNEGNTWIDPAIARIVLKQARKTSSIDSSTSNNTSENASENASDDKNPENQKVAIDPVDPEYRQMIENDPLTDRELEVLELIVAGCNNATISEKLFITVGTVKTHVRSILNKLCADDRTQAAVRALRSGLVE